MKKINEEQYKQLIEILKERFDNNMNRHPKIKWLDVSSKLEKSNEKLWSLFEMERTGGEPDIVSYDEDTKEYIFFDCSIESPIERRSLCYDNKALEARKENKPKGSAIGMASEMGIAILTKEEYAYLQSLGSFDNKTSSWIKTPDEIRKLGGSIFCDYRYKTVFTYHNGAESYYSSRGFRGSLKV